MAPWMLALITGSRRLVTQTFTSNTTFTVPYGVSRVNLSGKGQDGAAAVFASQTLDLFFCSLVSSSGGVPISAASAGSFGANQATLFDGAGVRTVNYTSRNYQIDSSDLTAYYDTAISVIVSGTGSASISTTSGNLTQANSSTNYGRYTIAVQQSPASTGADTTAFGKTFAGGVAGPATPASFTDVAVTENTAYPIVVPAGGSLTISYYR
jgi:hypothetical protein